VGGGKEANDSHYNEEDDDQFYQGERSGTFTHTHRENTYITLTHKIPYRTTGDSDDDEEEDEEEDKGKKAGCGGFWKGVKRNIKKLAANPDMQFAGLI